MATGESDWKMSESGGGVFVGTFTHALDPKKRLTIPSEWREQISGSASLYVIPGIQETCLCVLPRAEMERRLSSVGHRSITDTKARQFTRVLASRSDLVSWDSQGRIRIKDELLGGAGIKIRVALVGNFKFFELWNPDTLKNSRVMDDENLAEAVSHVGF